MRILAHIHAFNDREPILRCIRAVAAQTVPPSEILVVDNASDDGSAEVAESEGIVVIRHSRNVGTSGAVATGMQYAMAHGHDWIWVLDADSVPRADALRNLTELYRGLPADDRAKVGALGSLARIVPKVGVDGGGDDESPRLSAHRLTTRGPRRIAVPPEARSWDTDTVIWSGTLYRLAAVEKAGLPRWGPRGYWDDFNLDWGDAEMSYRLRAAGFRIMVSRDSVVEHPLGEELQTRFLARLIPSTNYPPFRRYLDYRNGVYFWLYLYPGRNLVAVAWFVGARLARTLVKILLLEPDPLPKMTACLRGVWDGVRKRLSPEQDPFPRQPDEASPRCTASVR